MVACKLCSYKTLPSLCRSKFRTGRLSAIKQEHAKKQTAEKRSAWGRVENRICTGSKKEDLGWDSCGKLFGMFVATCGAAALLSQPVSAITANNLLFLEAWRAVDRAYVDKEFNGQNWFKVREQALRNVKMDTQEETYKAIKDTLALLDDPFTNFFEPARFSALKGGTAGAVTGVGIEVGYETNSSSSKQQMAVITPVPNSPAAQAGVLAGDALLAVDGVSTSKLTLYEAGEKLQGIAGTEVGLTLKTRSEPPRDVVLKRERVLFNPVSYGICNGVNPKVDPNGSRKIGYLHIARFTSQTAKDVKEAILDLQEKKVESLLIDIRNNGGGSFPAGVTVARMLLGSGDVVWIADSQGVRDIVSVDGTQIDEATPMSVLVNRGTASASEVFSGAMQDNARGTIVGERTFGKGLIQTLIPLSDGSGVTVTASKYQTPSGRDINKVGILPDIGLPSGLLPDIGNSDKICRALTMEEAPALFVKGR
ncbi:hypothetical protein BSKO_04408 [Bryopsis sp. KO-2023]|nr:hypothetical protein BSKO_04408 [Bryopsis sp. KO-2023]